MYHYTLTGHSLQAALRYSLSLLLASAASFAQAQAPAQEQALTFTAGDAQLKWGPCPPFLPQGCGIAVLHGDPSKDNVDVFLKVPARSSIPLHWHTSAERMVLVAGELQVTYHGQKMAVLKPGTYAYGPPNCHTTASAQATLPVSSSLRLNRHWTPYRSKALQNSGGKGGEGGEGAPKFLPQVRAPALPQAC